MHGFRFDVWDSITQKWHALGVRTGSYEFPTIPRSVPIAQDGSFVSLRADRRGRRLDDGLVDAAVARALEGLEPRRAAAGRHDLPERGHPAAQPALRPELPDAAGLHRAPGLAAPTAVQHDVLRPRACRRPRREQHRLRQHRRRWCPARPLFNSWLPIGPLLYARFEPVPSPPLWLHAPKTVGESMERVVLRSNYNAAPVPRPSERHLVPPVTSVHLAEEHGGFDTSPGGPPDPTKYPDIVARDALPVGHRSRHAAHRGRSGGRVAARRVQPRRRVPRPPRHGPGQVVDNPLRPGRFDHGRRCGRSASCSPTAPGRRPSRRPAHAHRASRQGRHAPTVRVSSVLDARRPRVDGHLELDPVDEPVEHDAHRS